jgi:hypothetical protein
LPEDLAAKKPSHDFIQMTNVEVNLSCQLRDQYEFTGYPWRKEKLDHIRKQTIPGFMSIMSESVSEKMFQQLGLSVHSHVVIDFHRNKMESEGLRVTAPKPAGMSGGAVWKRCSDSDTRKLVAIAIEYRNDCLIGSRISMVLECIRAHFPQLSQYIPESNDIELLTTNNKQLVEPSTAPNQGSVVRFGYRQIMGQ